MAGGQHRAGRQTRFHRGKCRWISGGLINGKRVRAAVGGAKIERGVADKTQRDEGEHDALRRDPAAFHLLSSNR